MSETPSLNDYGPSDFSCDEEYQHWLTHAIAKLESRADALAETGRAFWESIDAIPGNEDLTQEGCGADFYNALAAYREE